ncbi:MAG: hypothetical protein WC097_05660 [Eubacteriales bacterium]
MSTKRKKMPFKLKHLLKKSWFIHSSFSGSPQQLTQSRFDGEEAEWVGTDADSAGQHAVQASPEVARDWSGIAGAIVGAAVAIENLLVNDSPKEKEPKKQVVERKNRQKKKRTHNHDWDLSL